MMAALELNGKSPSTVESYVREVYLVSKFQQRKKGSHLKYDSAAKPLVHRQKSITAEFAYL